MGFQELGLTEYLVKALTEAGYEAPTPVQEKSIPAAIAGRDLLVSSQTGSGKTAAFMLPALHRMNENLSDDPLTRLQFSGPRVLVLTPTRELALQVTEACRKYGRHLRYAKPVSVVGGMPYPVQNKQLSQKYDVLVATPGRLIDHMERGRIDFSSLQMLVLDEADRMLDMGFIDDIERILASLPAKRQTLLFSATVDARIEGMTRRLMNDPERIEIVSAVKGHANIEQRMLFADDMRHKTRLLDSVLRDATLEQAIVFTATKRDADSLAVELDGAGFAVAALHGDMSQSQRNRTLTGLRRGHYRVLVATDVAARGIDVQTISHVINFDLPKNPEDYVHRIGRTGRAGRSGIAISFASGRERFQVKAIERYTKNTITVHTIPGLEPKVEAPREPRRAPGAGPKRFGGPREGFGARREGGQFNRERPAYPQRDGNRGHYGQGSAGGNAPSRQPGAGFEGRGNAGGQFNRDGNRSFGGRDGNRDFNRDGNRDGNREFSRDGNREFSRDGNRDFNREGNRSNFNRDGNRSFGQDRRASAQPAQREGNREFGDRQRPRSPSTNREGTVHRRKFDR
ncbi:MAG: hypothetical protein RIR70_806 [Pseudomonadota bacterium]